MGIRVLDGHFSDLQTLAKTSPHAAAEEALTAARLFLGALVATATVLAAYLGRLAWRTLRSARYPPPGTRVLSDTRILRGDPARRYGRAVCALAVLLFAGSLGLAFVIDARLADFLDTTLKPTTVSPEELGLRP